MGKAPRIIGRATILLSVLGLIGKGIGFGRELVFAHFFGLDPTFEAFLVLSALPLILISSLLYFWQNYLVPEYKRTAIENPKQLKSLVYSSFFLTLLISSGLIVLLILFGETLIFSLQRTVIVSIGNISLFYFLILCSFLSASFSMLLISWNYVESKFSLSTLSHSVPAVVSIISVFLFHKSHGIFSVVCGFLTGYFLQTVVLTIFRPLKFKNNDYAPIKLFSAFNSSFFLILLIEIVGQLNIVIDRYFHSQVEQGGIAALNYAMTVYLLPLSVFSMALTTVTFPDISEANVTGDFTRLHELSRKGTLTNLLLFIPLSALLSINADAICVLLFEGGQFDRQASLLTGSLLKSLSVSFIFYSLYNLYNRFLYGLGKNKLLLGFTVFLISLKFVGNYLLTKVFSTQGLAYSTVVNYSLACLITGYFVYRLGAIKSFSSIMPSLFVCSLSAVVAYLMVIALHQLYFPELTKFSSLLQILIDTSVFIIVYLIGIFLSNNKDITDVARIIIQHLFR